MATHGFDESTHEDSGQMLELGIEVSTHEFEESTHEDSGQSKNEVSTHGLKCRHIEKETKVLKINDQESTHES